MPFRLQDKWSFSLVEDGPEPVAVDPLMLAEYVRGPRNPRYVLTITCDGVEVFVMRTRAMDPGEPLMEFKFFVDERHPLVALMEDANKGVT